MKSKKTPPRLEQKIKTVSHLTKLLKNSKSNVVFTNGCFDILHRGHVTYLEQARRLGDILVVALNSDDSVKALKGPSRPVQDFESRARVVAALASVDYVIQFTESTPVSVLSKIRPDIYVKGADWKGKKIPEEALVKSWDGKVKYLKFIQGHSSSRVIEKIMNG